MGLRVNLHICHFEIGCGYKETDWQLYTALRTACLGRMHYATQSVREADAFSDPPPSAIPSQPLKSSSILFLVV